MANILRKCLYSVVLIGLLASPVYPDKLAIKDGKLIRVDSIIDPKIELVAPTSIVPFMLVESKVEHDTADLGIEAHEDENTSFEWTVLEDGREIPIIVDKSDRKIAFFGNPRAKSVLVQLRANFKYELEDGPFTYEVEAAATITQDVPAPPTPPNPPPTPVPVPTNELARNILNWTNEVLAANPAVRAPMVDTAHQMAANFRVVSANITNSKYKTARESLSDLAQLNGGSIVRMGFTGAHWDSLFVHVQDYFEAKGLIGTAPQPSVLIPYLNDIATGLEAVK
jgi:hypothetical protein